MIRVTVWNEYKHEREKENVKEIYPHGMHAVIADFLKNADFSVRTATFDDDECGLSQEVIDNTDVLIWWGHVLHNQVPDEVALRVQEAVLKGMGIIFLHSAHRSKPFRALLGTACELSWRESGDYEHVWKCNPAHPIAQNIEGDFFKVEQDETYCEPFGIPEPDELVFITSFEGGEVIRSGCCYKRGYGKIFYFQPGHETYPVFYNKNVQQVISNAVNWTYSSYRRDKIDCKRLPEKI
jgi:trehalose utilization protein